MDFRFDETQEAVREAAAGVFEGTVTPERVRDIEAGDIEAGDIEAGDIEAGGDRVDHALWAKLAEADLLGLCVPERLGGGGMGLVELCVMLEAQGRCVAPVPLWETVALGALPVARFGSEALAASLLPEVAAGRSMVTAALAEVADDIARGGSGQAVVRAEPTGAAGVAGPAGAGTSSSTSTGSVVLHGTVELVPAAHVADRILVPARFGDGTIVAAVDPTWPGVGMERAETTNRQVRPHVHLDGVEVSPDDLLAGGDPGRGHEVIGTMLAFAWTGLCALQVGVCEAALAQTARYLNDREQFGRALSTFQGTMLRAADAAIDIEAMRVTLWEAAWRLDAGLDAERAVAVARWWSGDAGNRVVHATQHLHGGMGADVDYPIHRYFLWGKQIEVDLGGPSAHLARLGRQLVADLRSGAEVLA
ncbi:MAG: acyl-CoA/acyl-ACP dehydrogenase [Actinomycetota bacterium]|nr:acyl-CoA/acyl-ACP dehydrogenase [Actinomycetota bacterium]